MNGNLPEAFGHFSEDGREYLFTAPFAPPRAQINFLWNDFVISGLNQFGTGEGVFNNQTLTYNHAEGRVRLIRDGRRYFYLRDGDSGQVWNVALFPIRPPGATLTTRVGLGYSIFESTFGDLQVSTQVYLAPDEPVEIWTFTFANRGKVARQLWLCSFVEWCLGGYPTFGSPYSHYRSTFDENRHAVLSTNNSNERPHERYNAFVATDGEVVGWCGGRRDFLGPFGTVTNPQSLLGGTLANREACCEELAGVLAADVALGVDEHKKVTMLLGSYDTEAEKNRLIDKVMPAKYRGSAWQAMFDRKQSMLQAVQIRTPEPSIDRLVNVWAKHQVQLCVEFGRDGARGFRDTLQDAWGILPFKAPLAAAKIRETLSHQYSDGRGIRGWLPLQLHHYSDGPAWIAPVVTAYLKETGDWDFLEQQVPYLDEGNATVLGHMLRGVRHLSEDTGRHGLVLAHDGDWNDSLNWMGRGGKGESVWTSMALFHSLNLVRELADVVLQDGGLAEEMAQRATAMRSAIDQHGWDGQWYLAGYSDNGTPVGSQTNREGKVFLNSQTWAILTGLAQGERLASCLKTIDTMLESEHGSLTLWPAYTTEDLSVGRVTVILPGMYENGTPYCHGTAFKIVSDLVIGRADQALASYLKVMPNNDAHPSIRSGCEPYAFTNQYLGPDNARAGDSISGWITGTAGWMLRAITDHFCGVQPGYHQFVVNPCLPSAWPEVRLSRTLRGKTRNVHIRRAGGSYLVEVDGRQVASGSPVDYESF